MKKQADATLDAFQDEHIKQSNVIDAMRQELKQLTESNATSKHLSPTVLNPSVALSERNAEQEELGRLRLKLGEKEWALKNEMLGSKALGKENARVRKEHAKEITRISKRLGRILQKHGKSINGEEEVENLLDKVEDLVEKLEKKSKASENKYDSLLEMCNKKLLRREENHEGQNDMMDSSKSKTARVKDKHCKVLLQKDVNSVKEQLSQFKIKPSSSIEIEKNLKARIVKLDTGIKTLARTRNMNEGILFI